MTQPLHLKPTQPPSIREKDPWVCRSAAGVPRVDPGPAGRSLLAPTAGARGPGLAAPGLPLPPPRAPAPQMPAIAVLAAAAAAWCLLQVESRHLDALAGGAGPNNGNFLDNDQWLSTVSEYERDKYWNRFRDVSTRGSCGWRESLRARGGWWLGGRCGAVRCASLTCEKGAGADFAGSLWGRGSWASSCLRGTLKTTWKA